MVLLEVLTSLPDLSLAFFTLPYVPLPRVSRNSYLCFRLCLWWCLFTACFFTGTCVGALPTRGVSSAISPPTDGLWFDESRTTLMPSILTLFVGVYFRTQVSSEITCIPRRAALRCGESCFQRRSGTTEIKLEIRSSPPTTTNSRQFKKSWRQTADSMCVHRLQLSLTNCGLTACCHRGGSQPATRHV